MCVLCVVCMRMRVCVRMSVCMCVCSLYKAKSVERSHSASGLPVSSKSNVFSVRVSAAIMPKRAHVILHSCSLTFFHSVCGDCTPTTPPKVKNGPNRPVDRRKALQIMNTHQNTHTHTHKHTHTHTSTHTHTHTHEKKNSLSLTHTLSPLSLVCPHYHARLRTCPLPCTHTPFLSIPRETIGWRRDYGTAPISSHFSNDSIERFTRCAMCMFAFVRMLGARGGGGLRTFGHLRTQTDFFSIFLEHPSSRFPPAAV